MYFRFNTGILARASSEIQPTFWGKMGHLGKVGQYSGT